MTIKGIKLTEIENISSGEGPTRLEKMAVETKDVWSQSGDNFDKPFFLTQAERSDLPPLSEETRETLKDKGYSDEVMDSIGSEAEANIYTEAKLECQEINGKDGLIRTDIDPNQIDELGQTNLERMQQGRPPLDAQGKPIELHHIGQKQDSPLAELTRDEHRGVGNDNVLHDKQKESEIDRETFAKERSDHWKARAAQIATQD